MLSITLTAQDNTVSIFGYIKDKDGNSKENIKVTIDGQSYEATTDVNGFYCINGIVPGEYKIKFDYSELEKEYDIQGNIAVAKFERYINNLEIAFIYEEDIETKIDNYINQVKSIVKQAQNTPRILKFKYNNDNELENYITNLRQDKENENAFHKISKEGWNSVVLIFSDKSEEDIKELNRKCKRYVW